MPIIVAYLDVLGFSGYTEQDLSGAIDVLRHQQWILEQKLDDGTHHPAKNYNDPDLARVTEAHLVDSFDHFFSGSDSHFLVSEEPDKFISQLSNFLIECLQLVGHAYECAVDAAYPEAVRIKDVVAAEERNEYWFPPLWSGGLATGTFRAFRVTGIENRTRNTTPNMAGTAVVKAVRAGGTARGPRLFCEAGFENNFRQELRPLFRQVNSSMNELLWPAFAYMDGNNPSIEMNSFYDLWKPAVTLWMSKRGHKAFEHYDEFLRLLIRSFLAWGDIAGCGTETRRFARDRIRADLSESLIGAYLD